MSVTFKAMRFVVTFGETKKNEKLLRLIIIAAQQTYYGALNIWNNEFIVCPYPSGNGQNTVKFVEEIKNRHPHQQIMLLWDGASDHKGEEMKKILAKYNDGLAKDEWLITCELFAPYSPGRKSCRGNLVTSQEFFEAFLLQM